MILMHAKMMLEWFGYLGKIILHRFISVVWLTNIMSELRNLIKPLCWVGQPFQSVKRFQSFFGKSDTLMIACCLLLQRNIHDYINITGTTFFLSQIWYCWRLSPHCVIQQPHWLSLPIPGCCHNEGIPKYKALQQEPTEIVLDKSKWRGIGFIF